MELIPISGVYGAIKKFNFTIAPGSDIIGLLVE